jgi:hypothetical protein
MKLGFCIAVLILGTAQLTWGQTNGSALPVSAEATAREPSADRYAILGATAEQEALVHTLIRVMQPGVYSLRIILCRTGSTSTVLEHFASMCPRASRAPCSLICPAEPSSSTLTVMYRMTPSDTG